MADTKYIILKSSAQKNKFKTKTIVSCYSTYATPAYSKSSILHGTLSPGKIIKSDRCVSVKLKNTGKTVTFYHFPIGNYLNTDYWVPKYSVENGDQWLTTNIGSKTNNNKSSALNNPKLEETSGGVEATNKEFDFNDWVGRKGKHHNEYLHLLRSKMIVYEDRNKWIDSYNYMQFANPYTVQNGTRELLFFTKCDLNIMKNPTTLNTPFYRNAFWNEMVKKYRDQISMLQKGNAFRSGFEVDAQPFIPMLTNMVRSRLDLPSSNLESIETASTIYGTSLQYATHNIASDNGFDFSLEIADSPELEVYHFIKMYMEYKTAKSLGQVSPPGGDNKNYYRINRILHDEFAIYKFVLDADDMESILFYGKVYGVSIRSLPRDQFGDINPGEIRYNVDFHGQVPRDMNPIILFEFNKRAKDYFNGGVPNPNNYIPLWDLKYGEIDGSFRPCPFICECTNGKRTKSRYKLMWFKR